MTYSVYILQSLKNGKYYIGSTKDVGSRLIRHNTGHVKSTKNNRPYKVVYTEKSSSMREAYKREMKIKSYKGGDAFKKLVS